MSLLKQALERATRDIKTSKAPGGSVEDAIKRYKEALTPEDKLEAMRAYVELAGTKQ